ncbi:MAG TPA: sensor histidine kinase [Candidatus Dormibacteraeota bacterium]
MSVGRGRSATRALALGAAVLGVAGSAATVALVIANSANIASFDAADPISIVMPLTFAAVGGLIAIRHPRNPTGWLFLFIGVVEGLSGVADQYARLALITRPGALPGGQWALWFGNSTFGVVWPVGAAPMLLMLLPSGHLPSARWRPLAGLNLILAAVLALVFGALTPASLTVVGTTSPTLVNPTALSALQGLGQGPIGVVLYVLALVVVVAAAAAPFLRVRHTSGDERQQLKWIAYAVLIAAVVSAPLATLMGFFVSSTIANAATALTIVLGFGVALPAAAGVAIFRYRLYDIDIVISRTLVYGSLAVFITAAYVGIAVGIGALIGGGGKPNLGLSILATAIVAVGFQPVRERVQKVANRLVYGKRATPYEVLAQFSERVAESYATDDVMPRMARVLAEGTGAQRADVWLRTGDAWHDVAVWPAHAQPADPVPVLDGLVPDDGASRTVEVRHQGDLLGALSVTKRSGESLTPVEDSLLDHLAAQAGLVLKNVGLTSDLQARLEELRASRQRLVSAQDEERRRLERNLHDGAQQHLVALKVKLGLAEMLMGRDHDKAMLTIDQLKSDADDALDTLRDLARGIYPPLLADKGLGAALESQGRKATVPVTVDADGIGRYSQDVEAAVYFSVLEALQNVQKYAAASRVRIRLRADGGELHFSVDDDGRGFEVGATRKGSGLINMGDRLDAVGGQLQVSSTIGSGTSIAGRVTVYVAAAPLAADHASTSRSGLNSDLGMKQAAPTSSA